MAIDNFPYGDLDRWITTDTDREGEHYQDYYNYDGKCLYCDVELRHYEEYFCKPCILIHKINLEELKCKLKI
jgi:hypothetical protein